MAQATEEELEQGLSIADKILQALRMGGSALRGISEGSLGEGEVPSGGDFVRAGEDVDDSPQGIIQQFKRLGQIQSKGRVAQFTQEEGSADSAADRLLKLSQAQNQQSLVAIRPAKLDFAREKSLIENTNDVRELDRKEAELNLAIETAKREGDTETEKNGIALLEALTRQREVARKESLVPSEIEENLAGASADEALGGLRTEQAGVVVQDAATREAIGAAQGSFAESAAQRANTADRAQQALDAYNQAKTATERQKNRTILLQLLVKDMETDLDPGLATETIEGFTGGPTEVESAGRQLLGDALGATTPPEVEQVDSLTVAEIEEAFLRNAGISPTPEELEQAIADAEAQGLTVVR